MNESWYHEGTYLDERGDNTDKSLEEASRALTQIMIPWDAVILKQNKKNIMWAYLKGQCLCFLGIPTRIVLSDFSSWINKAFVLYRPAKLHAVKLKTAV